MHNSLGLSIQYSYKMHHVTLSGRERVSSFIQFANAYSPILLTVYISTFVRLEQPKNALSPILVMPKLTITVYMPVSFWNSESLSYISPVPLRVSTPFSSVSKILSPHFPSMTFKFSDSDEKPCDISDDCEKTG